MPRPPWNATDPAPITGEASLAEGPLAEAVFHTLLTKIYDGRLQVGALLNEAALADEFRVSRGPVREAIRRLQGFQLVTREPYQRARVVTLTEESVRQLFEVRMALEGLACNLAAQRMSDTELQQIAVDLDAYRTRVVAPGATPPRGSGEQKAFDFHERIVRGCGNARIADMLCGDMYHLLRIYRKRSGAVPDRRAQAHQEHWQILRALQARDGELAESLMRAHIARANEMLVQTRSGVEPRVASRRA
jgi:DNA-binding GntR family transcriptional regulator